MRKPLLLIGLLAACAKPDAPAPAAATTETLATVGDSTTIIESVALFAGKRYEIDPATRGIRVVGLLPIPCGYLGSVADSAGNLLIACQDSGTVYRVARERLGLPDFDPKKDPTVFITGAGHANGLTIAPDGHVWISGGDIDALYHTGPAGGKAILFAEKFSPISPDTTIGPRVYVTNGAAVDSKGNVYTMNTGTGTIWRLEVRADHAPGAISKVAESPHLIGADGVVVGPGDTLYATQNFNNTFAKIAPTGEFTVLVQATDGLRFPAELVRDGKVFYIANLNFPVGANAAGHRPGASVAKVTLP